MSTTIEATFDGSVFRPKQAIALAPNTLVQLTVRPIGARPEQRGSFLDTARALKLEGPPDWASNLDKYLYGEERQSAARFAESRVVPRPTRFCEPGLNDIMS